MTAVASNIEQNRPPLTPVPGTEFDSAEFRRMAREALIASGSPDPAVAAAALLDSLTDAQCRLGLSVTLTGWLRSMAGNTDRAVRHEVVAVPAEPRKTPTTAERVNSWYQRTLATRVMAGAEWKFLRDCTPDDLANAAEVRFKAAAATKAEGDRLAALAEHMRTSGAKTVAKVKPEALQRIYGGQS